MFRVSLMHRLALEGALAECSACINQHETKHVSSRKCRIKYRINGARILHGTHEGRPPRAEREVRGKEGGQEILAATSSKEARNRRSSENEAVEAFSTLDSRLSTGEGGEGTGKIKSHQVENQ